MEPENQKTWQHLIVKTVLNFCSCLTQFLMNLTSESQITLPIQEYICLFTNICMSTIHMTLGSFILHTIPSSQRLSIVHPIYFNGGFLLYYTYYLISFQSPHLTSPYLIIIYSQTRILHTLIQESGQ